ncbi:MAG: Exodeoxyribonuclease 7 small subunit [Candidatus Saccharibacteria bacterium]|nr:Exodeoxyribonuclease 7 small subunit [Candidatus Saccharibacteria bacterium]
MVSKDSKKDSERNYQTIRAELDAVLDELQDEQLDVDSALKMYEQGLALVNELTGYLQAAENKVIAVKAKFE